MYVRLRVYGQSGAINSIRAKNINGIPIPLTASNLLNTTGYGNNTNTASEWFGETTGNRPFALTGQYAEINLFIPNILTIEVTSYISWSYSATKVEVYSSEDNVSFIHMGDLQYTEPSIMKSISVIPNINKILLLQENGEVNSIDSISKTITKIPSSYEQSLIKYGMNSPVQVDGIFSNKNYILSKNESENTDGLLVQEINRKPLSIKFE